ncbi:alkyl sulfatase dimerization domain-containing protein [Streptacidiphilus melanogenes]|uniref:alkyl sulfatase dimerization domain-containing protein n=1 Tax=Streptacidiphilus melanogenes TaxID=411235 RepID=UPI0005A8DF7A|nr:alkyl sulfatase dimerization domain-containing protein [Streptacidiphilus melanogenes]
MSDRVPADYRAYLDRVWEGEASIAEHMSGVWSKDGLIPVAAGAAIFAHFANVTAFDTGDGLVLIDSGEWRTAGELHRQVRAWSDAPVTAVVFTHGHVDHVFGVGPFDAEAEAAGGHRPEVIAHELVAERFDRYTATAGYNSWINRRQFQLPALEWPTEYRCPDTVYRDTLTYRRGELTFELHHARGETDDATWVWIPELRALCTGDLFIWNAPNAGNPQKVQRYPQDWARALRAMQDLDPELLLPGHGVPIVGADRVRQALGETAELLETLVEQTLDLMNAGARLDEIVHTVHAPGHLLARPYLRPLYDEPEFVVRNLWRQFGGWYDQNPAHLKSAPDAALAAEVARLAGGPRALAARATVLLAEGEDRLAAHLAEWAAQAAPGDRDVAAVRADVYGRRAELERSTMAKGVFTWAACESRAQAAGRDMFEILAANRTGERDSLGTVIASGDVRTTGGEA